MHERSILESKQNHVNFEGMIDSLSALLSLNENVENFGKFCLLWLYGKK